MPLICDEQSQSYPQTTLQLPMHCVNKKEKMQKFPLNLSWNEDHNMCLHSRTDYLNTFFARQTMSDESNNRIELVNKSVTKFKNQAQQFLLEPPQITINQQNDELKTELCENNFNMMSSERLHKIEPMQANYHLDESLNLKQEAIEHQSVSEMPTWMVQMSPENSNMPRQSQEALINANTKRKAHNERNHATDAKLKTTRFETRRCTRQTFKSPKTISQKVCHFEAFELNTRLTRSQKKNMKSKSKRSLKGLSVSKNSKKVAISLKMHPIVRLQRFNGQQNSHSTARNVKLNETKLSNSRNDSRTISVKKVKKEILLLSPRATRSKSTRQRLISNDMSCRETYKNIPLKEENRGSHNHMKCINALKKLPTKELLLDNSNLNLPLKFKTKSITNIQPIIRITSLEEPQVLHMAARDNYNDQITKRRLRSNTQIKQGTVSRRKPNKVSKAAKKSKLCSREINCEITESSTNINNDGQIKDRKLRPSVKIKQEILSASINGTHSYSLRNRDESQTIVGSKIKQKILKQSPPETGSKSITQRLISCDTSYTGMLTGMKTSTQKKNTPKLKRQQNVEYVKAKPKLPVNMQPVVRIKRLKGPQNLNLPPINVKLEVTTSRHFYEKNCRSEKARTKNLCTTKDVKKEIASSKRREHATNIISSLASALFLKIKNAYSLQPIVRVKRLKLNKVNNKATETTLKSVAMQEVKNVELPTITNFKLEPMESADEIITSTIEQHEDSEDSGILMDMIELPKSTNTQFTSSNTSKLKEFRENILLEIKLIKTLLLQHGFSPSQFQLLNHFNDMQIFLNYLIDKC